MNISAAMRNFKAACKRVEATDQWSSSRARGPSRVLPFYSRVRVSVCSLLFLLKASEPPSSKLPRTAAA